MPQFFSPQLSQGILAQGNKRDSVPLAQRSALPDLTRKPYEINWTQPLLQLGAGILGGKNLREGLSQGAAGFAQGLQQDQANFNKQEDDRIQGLVNQTQLQQGQERIDQDAQQYAEGAPMRKLQLQELQQKLDNGDVVNLGGGRFWDKSKRGQPGEFFNDPGFAAQQAQVAGAEEAARTAAQGDKWQNTGPVMTKDGEVLGDGWTNGKTPQVYVASPDGKGLVPAPAGARQASVNVGGPITPHDFNKLEEKLTEDEVGQQKILDYYKANGGAGKGFERLYNEASANVKSFFGNPLNVQELKLQLAQGKAQALLGALRLEVLGPGVLTESDAQRIMSYIGGDVNALQNPATLRAALQDVLAYKSATYRTHIDQFNRAAPYYNGGKTREAKDFSLPETPNDAQGTGTTTPSAGGGNGTVTGKTPGGVTFTYTP